MPPQPVHEFAAFGIIDAVLKFFQREMDDVMMVDFIRRNLVAELEPDSVQKVDLFRRKVGSVRSKIKHFILSVRKIELKRNFRLWISQTLPCQTGDTRILHN